MIQELRSKQVLKKVAELLALGMSAEQIRDEINKDFSLNVSSRSVARMIKTYSVKRKEFINTDKEFSELYKSLLTGLINQAKKNLKDLESTRELILNKIDEYRDTSEKGLLIYINQLNSAVRTQNDSIRTLNELLKRLEIETKETTISTIQLAQLSLESLKELENLGLIIIKKDYYKELGDNNGK